MGVCTPLNLYVASPLKPYKPRQLVMPTQVPHWEWEIIFLNKGMRNYTHPSTPPLWRKVPSIFNVNITDLKFLLPAKEKRIEVSMATPLHPLGKRFVKATCQRKAVLKEDPECTSSLKRWFLEISNRFFEACMHRSGSWEFSLRANACLWIFLVVNMHAPKYAQKNLKSFYRKWKGLKI